MEFLCFSGARSARNLLANEGVIISQLSSLTIYYKFAVARGKLPFVFEEVAVIARKF
jgi:hypothetical protein